MAEEKEIDTVTVNELPSLALKLENLFAHSDSLGNLYKGSFADLAAFLAPYITAVGGSGFVATTGTVLPPASAGKFTIVGAGTYTQTTGGSITTTEILNILGSSATSWALVTAINANSLVSKDYSGFGGRFSTVAEANTAIPNTVVNGKNQRSGKIVFIGTATDYVSYWWKGGTADTDLIPYIEVTENSLYGRILPTGYLFEDFDRPDAAPLVLIDKNGYILDNGDNSELENLLAAETAARIKGDNIGEVYDRDDIEVVFIDVNGNILAQPGSSDEPDPEPTPVIVDVNAAFKTYWEPPAQPVFQSPSVPAMLDYPTLIAQWDALITEFQPNPQLTPYITKTSLGKSSIRNFDIYKYEFKPPNPKYKIILMAGVHASEKVYIYQLPIFMRYILSNWQNNEALNVLRWDTHIICVPCVSPASLGYMTASTGSMGSRRVWETEPFPVTWSKTGAETTITFNASDFPATGGRLDANTYFSGAGLVGKLWVSFYDSSNTTALPNNGYVIASVVNGRTITVISPDSSTASGTGKLYVSVDPNRNYNPTGSTAWADFVPQATVLKYSEHVAVANENKGTKPFSITESKIIADLLAAQKQGLNFHLDGHAGAGDNYLSTIPLNTIEGLTDNVQMIKYLTGQFNKEPFDIKVVALPSPVLTAYAYLVNGTLGFTIEWSYSVDMTSKQMTDSLRWMSTIIVQSLLNIK